jgi:hypothetical protein
MAGDGYFAALSRAATGVTADVGAGDDLGGGGHVASRLSSAAENPSFENFAACATRRPSGACEVSVNSNCATPAID